MFARHVAVKLKSGTLDEFTRVMDNEILPWLRKQKGFLDTITLSQAAEKSCRLASGIKKKMHSFTIQTVIQRHCRF